MSKLTPIIILVAVAVLAVAGPTNDPPRGPHGILVDPVTLLVTYPSAFWASNSAAIAEALNLSIPTGSVSSVFATNGVTGGGSSGIVTVSLDRTYTDLYYAGKTNFALSTNVVGGSAGSPTWNGGAWPVDDTVTWSEISGISGTGAQQVAQGNHGHPAGAISGLGALATEDDAPADGTQYARQDGAWVEVPSGGSMDYAAVDGASNLALAAYGLGSNNAAGVAAVGAVATNAALAAGAAGVDATNALVRVTGLGVAYTNFTATVITQIVDIGTGNVVTQFNETGNIQARWWGTVSGGGGIDPEIASNAFVVKTGDGGITGPLGQNVAGTGIIITSSVERVLVGSTGGAAGNGSVVVGDGGENQNYWVAVGYDQQCTGDGNGGVQIGYDARAGKRSTAVGYATRAQGPSGYGVAVGQAANADEFGTTCGAYGAAGTYGSAFGYDAEAIYNGVAIGAAAWGTYGATAVGRGAMSVNTNIAIGYLARAYGIQRVSIGTSVSNTVDNSTALRGDLYLDGATNIALRSVFGSGAWTFMRTDGTNLFFVNNTNGIEQLTNL